MHPGNHTCWVGIRCGRPACVVEGPDDPYGATMNRWMLSIVVIGLIIGFAGIFTHNDRALALGIVLSLGGLWLAVH